MTSLNLGGADGLHRVLPRSTIEAVVALHCFPFETRAGDGASARHRAGLALDRWMHEDLPFRPTAEGPRFDAVEVLNFMKHVALTGRDGTWTETAVRAGRRLVDELRALFGASTPPAIAFTLERTFGPAPGTAAAGPRRLRAPLPFGSPGLNVEVARSSSNAGHVTLEPAVARACVRASAVELPTIKLELLLSSSTTASAVGSTLSAEERELYLRRREGLIVTSPAIDALAARVCGRAKDIDAVRKVWDFFFDDMRAGSVHVDTLDPSDPLRAVAELGWFDCYTGSALFVALCRSTGTPARMVGGFSLYPVAPTNHYWVEAWLESSGSWVPFDVTQSWGLAAGDQSSAWSDHFFGRVDPRLTTERLPRVFTGATGVAFPKNFYMVQRQTESGVDVAHHALEDDALLYRDAVASRPLTAAETIPANAAPNPAHS